MTTPILKITEAANGQVDQYLTYNEALRALESSTNNFYVVDMSAGNVTLTDSANVNPALNYIFSRNQVFRTSGNTVARVLTVPQSKRLFVVQNGGTFAVTVKRGTTEISLNAALSAIFYSDGTADGLSAVSTGSGSGGGVSTIVAGDGIDVDNTDPANPIVSATGGGGGGTGIVESIVAGGGISVDDSDPANPIVSATGIPQATMPLLRYPVNVFGKGVGASTSIAGYEFDKLNSNTFDLLSGVTAGGGWLASLSSSPWIDLEAPFGVVIGDSIAEGHPALHGRLHPSGSAGFDPDYASEPGQINYRLSQLTNTHWYNHGVGGQTTAQVLSRFDRDALGKVSDPGDGRGSSTLKGKPYAVLVSAGVNDVAASIPTSTIIGNLTAMCDMLTEDGIIPIFMTCGHDNDFDSAKIEALLELNVEMKAQLPAHGAHIVDFYSWGSDGAGGLKPGLFADAIHPNKAGYTAFADYVINNVDADLVLQTLRIGSIADPSSPPTSWAKPVYLQVQRGSTTVRVQMVGDEIDLVAGALPPELTAKIRVTISYPTSGNGGFSRAVGSFSRKVDAKPQSMTARVACVIEKTGAAWAIASGFVQRGAFSISEDSSAVTVTTEGCAIYTTSLVGSNSVTNNLKVSATWGNPPANSVSIRFGDGASAVPPSSAPVGVYVAIIGFE